MKAAKGVAASLAAMSILFTVPAQAGGTMSQAEKLRRLDIMLMVTGLRCRTTADNFQADYGRFSANHIAELNAASNALKADFARDLGVAGALKALDKLSVTMANRYGQGHPWLGCNQLKRVAQGLADAKGEGPLLEAADQLLGEAGGTQLALVHR